MPSLEVHLVNREAEVLQYILESIENLVMKKVEPQSELFESGTLDSLTRVDLLVMLQNHFSIELLLSQMTAENFGTPVKATQTVLQLLREKK
jgi:D-alanine--poly(phosphoribitol) ligase subunit 2